MIDMHLIRGAVFERCQRGQEMRATSGEAGHGIYAYPAGMAQMRDYYSAQGEDIFRLTMRQEAVMVDLTRPTMMGHLMRYASEEMRPDAFSGARPVIRPDTLHRFGWTIENFMRKHAPEADGWLVLHQGPGLPQGKQAVILDIEKFVVEPLEHGPEPGF